ncbi:MULTISPECIES: hypothetical protein [unclassified Vibrio]|uniref:hypothetical protein n=1 Tax=Vibrio TaxID=662 RepID=UPI0014832CE5|nr:MULTISPECIES: hypothetical protein [unclassified Vibrio]NNN41940.1 hypothetical protein [Vibrio sp. 2-2(2)]NNO05062.1 hypothetical protein [Vibrio sp. 7-5(1-a)]
MYNDNKPLTATKNIATLIVITISLFSLGLFYPFIALSLVMLFSVFVKIESSIYIWVISSSMFFGILSSILDLNFTYYADLARYYALFENYSILQSVIDFKVFRGIIYEILKFYGLKVEYYSLISVFLTFFLIQITSVYIIYNLGYKVESTKEKLLYISTLFCLLPIVMFLGYETFLAIAFFFFGAYLFTSKNRMLGGMSFFLACLTHIFTIYFIIVFFASILFKRKGILFYIGSLCAFVILLFATNHRLSIGVKFIDKPLVKLYNYFNGPWSEFSTIHDKALIIYVLLKLIFIFIILMNVRKIEKLKQHYLIKMMIISLPLIIIFMLSRTLSLRLVEFGFIIYLPIVYIFYLHFSTKKMRIFILVFLFINILSYHNMLYSRFVFNYMNIGNGYFMVMNFSDIKNFKSNMASDKLIFDIKRNQ